MERILSILWSTKVWGGFFRAPVENETEEMFLVFERY